MTAFLRLYGSIGGVSLIDGAGGAFSSPEAFIAGCCFWFSPIIKGHHHKST
jgi:hypothetical protein